MANEGLKAILHAVDTSLAATPPTPTNQLSHAPLIERATALMPEAVLKNYETTANSLEEAANALEHEMQSHVALMREEAQSIRSQGDSYAKSIEAAAILIRDVNRVFRDQADKLNNFRAGVAA